MPDDLIAFLEGLTVQGRNCEIVFRSEEGGRAVIRDRIMKVYEEGGGYWLRTGGGLSIRLEKLVQVDGRIPSNFT